MLNYLLTWNKVDLSYKTISSIVGDVAVIYQILLNILQQNYIHKFLTLEIKLGRIIFTDVYMVNPWNWDDIINTNKSCMRLSMLTVI
jgi:hypothetical protein